jgi:hypothetical protein
MELELSAEGHEALEPEIHFRTAGGATRGNTPPRGGRGATSSVFQGGSFRRLAHDHPKASEYTHVCSEGLCGDNGGTLFKLTKDLKDNWVTSKAVKHLKVEHPTTTGAVYLKTEGKLQVRTLLQPKCNNTTLSYLMIVFLLFFVFLSLRMLALPVTLLRTWARRAPAPRLPNPRHLLRTAKCDHPTRDSSA